MQHPSDATALILVPGLRPPVPPRSALGKRCPAAGPAARRIARTGDIALAAGLGLAAVAVVTAMSVPAGVVAALFLCGQVALAFRRPAVEVPRV